MTDQSGATTDTFQYAPYGELVNRGEEGMMTDENGLCCMGARYYNPDIKRFINLEYMIFMGII